MPETRYIRNFDVSGKELPSTPYEVSDEQLTEEAEEQAMARVDELIDEIDSIAKARIFLKRLVKRLVRKGVLP